MPSTGPSKNSAATFVLSCLSLLPAGSALGQEGREKAAQDDKPAAQSTTEMPETPTLSDLALPLQDQGADLPQRVLDEAMSQGIETSGIKLEMGQWVACTDGSCIPLLPATGEEIAKYGKPEILTGLKVGDELIITEHHYKRHVVESEPNYGIEGLGKFSTGANGKKTFTPDPSFKGTVYRTKGDGTRSPAVVQDVNLASGLLEFNYSQDNLAESLKNLSDLRNRILGEPGTTFVLVVSVPSQCKPCVQYKPLVEEAASQAAQKNEGVVYVVYNFENFAQTTKVTGVSRFPTTVVFPAVASANPFTDYSARDWQSKPFLMGISRPGYKQIDVIQTGPLRELVRKGREVADSVVSRGVNRVVETLSEFAKFAK
jgi:hypothetical protein